MAEELRGDEGDNLAEKKESNARSSCAAPHVQHAHNFSTVVDREENPVRVRLPPVCEYSYGVTGVEALGCHWTPLRMLVE
jgi:hypothetical protein